MFVLRGERAASRRINVSMRCAIGGDREMRPFFAIANEFKIRFAQEKLLVGIKCIRTELHDKSNNLRVIKSKHLFGGLIM